MDDNGNIYIIGQFRSWIDLDLDPNNGTFINSTYRQQDVYVAAYQDNGNSISFKWAINLPGRDRAEGSAITTDGQGNITIAGHFTSDLEVLGNNYTSAGSYDIFMAGLKDNGSSASLSWSFQVGDTKTDQAYSLAVNQQGDFYVTGNFEENCNFDPLGGNANAQLSAQDRQPFLAKYDANGQYLWGHHFDGGQYNTG